MRRIRYQVACSLDGFIAGPNGDYDWIVMDPDIDFAAMFAEYDTLLMGRETFALAGQSGQYGDTRIVVCSRTLRQEDYPSVTVIDNIEESVTELRAQPGKDIWLFGGGVLFRSLLEMGLVDTVEPAVIPVLLGGGIPMLPETDVRTRLKLRSHRLYEKSGIMLLQYDVIR